MPAEQRQYEGRPARRVRKRWRGVPPGEEGRPLRRRWTALLLTLCLCLSLVSSVSAEEEVIYYHLVVNDKYPLDTPQPIRVSGTVYVPYTVFDRDTTGVNLGITCVPGQIGDDRTLTLASIGGMLTFNISAKNWTCVDMEGGYHSMQAIVRNGKTFVPLNGVVNYFKQYMTLDYAQRTTRYGLLIRIYNGNASLDNDRFMEVAAESMRTEYDKFIKSLTPAPPLSPAPDVSPGPGPTERPGEAPDNRSDIRVYLALQYSGGGQLAQALDVLARYDTPALLLFRPGDLAQNADLVRRAAGEGHALGLIPDGATAEELAESLAEGNRLLARIAWRRTHIALLPEGQEAAGAALADEGWYFWTENISPVTDGERAAAARVLKSVGQKRSYARIRLDDSVSALGALPRILTALRADRYTLRLAVESEL